MQTLKVAAGRGAIRFSDFERHSVVAIGGEELGDLSKLSSRDEVRALVERTYPEWRKAHQQSWAGQVARFLFSFQADDRVLTYDPAQRIYLVGRIAGPYEHAPGIVPEMPHIRRTSWEGRISRDDLTVTTRNTLGAIMALFQLGPDAAAEIEERLAGIPLTEPAAVEERETGAEQLRQDVIAEAREFIKDRVLKLDWEEAQELVAGCIRAMGYRTRILPRGSDRGQDIVASPDGLGLEHPRVVIEVKHREREQIGAPHIRSFLGGRHPQDRCLYVSTGGFTKEARYEADRSPIPITLLDLDDLVDLLVENYEKLGPDTRALVPLIRFYWPAT